MLLVSQRTGFKHIFLIGVYLLSIFNLPRALSKPIATMEEEFWILTSNKTDKGNNDASSICNFVSNMCTQASIAKYHVKDFQSKHNSNGPKIDLSEFLPNVNPDNKGSDEIDSSEFASMELNEFVKQIYQYLQKFAVGLNLMYKNQTADMKEDTYKQIIRLKNLLFEIHDYLSAYDINFVDIKSDDLPKKYTEKMDASWLRIFSSELVREYVKTLNYVHAGLSYFNQTECN